MLSLWNLYLLLPLSLPLSLHVTAFTGENAKETQQPGANAAEQPSQRPHGSGSTPENAMFGTEKVDLLGGPLSWHLLSSEDSDGGVIGEYADIQEGTETPLLYPNERGLVISRPPGSATEDATSKERTLPIRSPSGGVPPQPAQEQQTLKYQSAETSTEFLLHSTQTGENQPTPPASQNETTGSQSPFLLSGSLPPDQDSTPPLSAGPGPRPERPTPPVSTGSWGWTTGPSVITQGETQEGTVSAKGIGDGLIDITDRILHRGAVNTEANEGKSLSFNETDCIWSRYHSLNLTPITVNTCPIWPIVNCVSLIKHLQ